MPPHKGGILWKAGLGGASQGLDSEPWALASSQVFRMLWTTCQSSPKTCTTPTTQPQS